MKLKFAEEKMLKDNKGGMELIAAVIIAVILAVVGAGIIGLSYNHYKIVKEKSVDKERGYQFALGGIQKAVHEVQKGGFPDTSALTAANPIDIPNAGNETWEGLNVANVKVIGDHDHYTPSGVTLAEGEYMIEATTTY